MKKQYTKKQIQEAIAYWEKRLERMDESASGGVQFEFYRRSEAAKALSDGDLEAIAGLRSDLYAMEKANWSKVGVVIDASEACTKEGVAEALGESPYTVIAKDGGKVVGFITTSDEKHQDLMPGNIYLDEDCVDPGYRGSGVGTEMVKRLLDGCASEGVTQFTASVDLVNIASEKHLMKNGFAPIQKEYVYVR